MRTKTSGPAAEGRRPTLFGRAAGDRPLIFCIFNLISLQNPDLGYKLDLGGTFVLHFFCISLPDRGGIVFTFFLHWGLWSQNSYLRASGHLGCRGPGGVGLEVPGCRRQIGRAVSQIFIGSCCAL